jgi:hypothetical protein
MDSEKVLLVIGITLIVVIFFNFAIYRMVIRKSNRPGEFEMFRRALKRARDPWRDENANREALSKMVAELQNSQNSIDATDDQ